MRKPWKCMCCVFADLLNNTCVDDEYKALVDKYQTVKTTFEKKMLESCRVSCLSLYYYSLLRHTFMLFKLHLSCSPPFQMIMALFGWCFWVVYLIIIFHATLYLCVHEIRYWYQNSACFLVLRCLDFCRTAGLRLPLQPPNVPPAFKKKKIFFNSSVRFQLQSITLKLYYSGYECVLPNACCGKVHYVLWLMKEEWL